MCDFCLFVYFSLHGLRLIRSPVGAREELGLMNCIYSVLLT